VTSDVSKEHLTQIGGTGVFVSTLREGLLCGEVDFAVHSLKDLPTASPAGITLEAGCSAPVGTYATERHSGSGRLRLDAVVLGAGVLGNAAVQGVDVSPGSEIMVVREHGEADSAARGSAARGSAARGSAARGSAARGSAATGDAATGDAATGDAATGDAATGSAIVGSATTDREDVDD
jgi:porphobilinogen deaminase